MNGPTRSEIAENWTGPDYQDETELIECDRCGEEFDVETMKSHEDGNLYCESCNYATRQDLDDAYADECQHAENDR